MTRSFVLALVVLLSSASAVAPQVPSLDPPPATAPYRNVPALIPVTVPPGAAWPSGPLPISTPLRDGVLRPQAIPEGTGGRGLPARALEDLGRGVWHLAEDGWHLLTVPTRLDREDAWLLAGVLGVGGLLYVWDEGLTEALRRQEGHRIHDAVRDVGDFVEPIGLMGNTNVWYAAGTVVGYLTGWDPLLHVSRDLLVSHWLAAGTYNPPRSWIGRYRPEEGMGPRAFGSGTSLPSGHSSSIVQVAAVLSHHIGWKPASVALWGLAGTLLVQRVDSGKHWPSDVWIGAAWGYGVTRMVLARAEERRGTAAPASPAHAFSVTPWVDGRSGRPGVAVTVPWKGF